MTVHFIGASPGAPDLLTLRGRDLIAGPITGATRPRCQDDIDWPQKRPAHRPAHRAVQRDPMTVAKLDFRNCHAVAVCRNGLIHGGGQNGVTVLGRFSGLSCGAPAMQTTRTHSPGVKARTGTGSSAEVAALAESPLP